MEVCRYFRLITLKLVIGRSSAAYKYQTYFNGWELLTMSKEGLVYYWYINRLRSAEPCPLAEIAWL